MTALEHTRYKDTEKCIVHRMSAAVRQRNMLSCDPFDLLLSPPSHRGIYRTDHVSSKVRSRSFYHGVHKEVSPAPGLPLHEVAMWTIGSHLERVRLADHLRGLDVVHKTSPAKRHIV